MDAFEKKHLLNWVNSQSCEEEEATVLYQALSAVVEEDPYYLDRGWPATLRAAEMKGLIHLDTAGYWRARV